MKKTILSMLMCIPPWGFLVLADPVLGVVALGVQLVGLGWLLYLGFTVKIFKE